MNEKCCANCEYWEEKYWKCEHTEQFASKAEDYAAMPDSVCELYDPQIGEQGGQY